MQAKPSVVFSFIFICTTLNVFSQGAINIVDRSINPGMVIEEFNNKVEEKTEQYYYYTDAWLLSSIKLKNGVTLKDFQTKFDLINHQLELKIDDVIKICPYQLIEQFVLINPLAKDSNLFVDIKKYEFYDGTPSLGFFEIISSGEYSLAAQHLVEKKQSDYVEALDMGNRTEKLVKLEKYFVIKDKKVLCELRNNVKKIECPGINERLPPDFKIKMKTESDKVKFIDYLNQM